MDELKRLNEENSRLQDRIKELEAQLASKNVDDIDRPRETGVARDVLSNIEISRYGRQLIMPELGPEGDYI